MTIFYRPFASLHRDQITAALRVYFEYFGFACFRIGKTVDSLCRHHYHSYVSNIAHFARSFLFINSFDKIHYFGFGSTLNYFECHVCRCLCAIEYRIQSRPTKTRRSQFYTLSRFLWYRIDCDRDNDIISILIANQRKITQSLFENRTLIRNE